MSTAIHELRWLENKLEIKSSLQPNKDKILTLKDVIARVCATNDLCWICLANGSLFTFDFVKSQFNEFTHIDEKISDMACTQEALLAITNNNCLIKLSKGNSKKIFMFPKHQRIKKIVSGAEHCLLMTTNGDLFSVGCGLRGALGHSGEVNSLETPKQIEALAGLKIIDIAAGSFHSVAVSSFGDVYTWGWNTNGQLGLPKVAKHTFEKVFISHQQVFTSPRIIELEDDHESVKEVYCGGKHTILKTDGNRLFATGLNNYGQLGLSSDAEDVDVFTEIPVTDVSAKTRVVCGYWSTYLLNC